MGLLGAGGYGEVWVAVDAAREWNYVAIKLLRPSGAAAEVRFQNEMRALMLLGSNHHIVKLLDHGVQVHGQVVVCPGVNDGAVLDDTLCGVLDRYPELASLCIVPRRTVTITSMYSVERKCPTIHTVSPPTFQSGGAPGM